MAVRNLGLKKRTSPMGRLLFYPMVCHNWYIIDSINDYMRCVTYNRQKQVRKLKVVF